MNPNMKSFFICISINILLLPKIVSSEESAEAESATTIQPAQGPTPFDRAVALVGKFSELKFLTYDKQCANPKLIKENVELLLNTTDLQTPKVDESTTLYNRWNEYGGYRCDPAQFICMRESPPKPDGGPLYTLYKCFCPVEVEDFQDYNKLAVGFGNQKAKKLEVPEGDFVCEFENIPYGDKVPFEIKGPNGEILKQEVVTDTEMIPDKFYPVPTSEEIICGIYHSTTYYNVHDNTQAQTIDSGLYFHGIKCPQGLQCLMKEFLVSCTAENAQVLYDTWIVKKGRRDRRVHWPICSCVQAAQSKGTSIPTVDPVEEEISKLQAALPQAGFDMSCDNNKMERIKTILNSNWYLYPRELLDLAKEVYEEVKRSGGSGCAESKGLECSKDTNKCVCKRTPKLPGFSPEVPTATNSNGFCQLDTNSDCDEFDAAKEFRCKDGEQCLVHKYNYKCTNESKEYVKNELIESGLGEQTYLQRCRCTKEEVVKFDVKSGGVSCMVIRGRNLLGTLGLAIYIRVRLLL